MSAIPKPKKRRKKSKRLSEELAQQVLEDWNHMCAMCGAWNVELHHVIYGASGRKHYKENLIPLCKEHHDLVHTSKKKWQPVLQEMTKNKYQEG